MQHAKSLLLVIAIIAVLGGCTSSYRTTLEQELEDKSPAERRATLSQECGAEIARSIKASGPASQRHFEKMKRICEEMTGQHILVVPDAAVITQ